MDCIRPLIGIVTSLWPFCVTHANYLYKLQENRDSLEEALNELKNVRDDVLKRVEDAEANSNEPMKRNDQVNRWLQSVTTIEGEVVEILRQVDQQTSRRCLGDCCPDNCWSGYMVGRSIVQNIASLDELRKKGVFEEVAYKLPPPSVQEEPTNTTVGMKSMFDKVWKLLAEDEVRIMGLYGYGGVGKTTLLKQINNAFLKSTITSGSSSALGFDVVILVVVSKVINIEAIQKEIGKRLGLSSTEADKTRIFNALVKKNFLLLLDDIWETVDLQSIGVPPPENSKSKVIFTTRSETVCELMKANEILKVQCLPWNEAWSLFQKEVGKRALNSHPDVPELAKVVARECGGLPLPLITIGRAMSSKKTVREWNHAITTLQKSALDFPGMGEEVLPLLKQSYDSLRNDTIKSCFLYCALFPEHKSIDIPTLIDYWIGEGFILLNEFGHIDEARNHGHDIIGILKSECLLESSEKEETQVKMHDVIRDLALWITRECGSSKMDKMLTIETCDLMADKLCNAKRIYLRPLPHNGEKEVGSPPKSPNLLTLIFEFTHDRLLIIPQNFFEFTSLLRVLVLSNCDMETFPISLTELLELRYLSLSGTYIKVLPKELGKLVKLNYFILPYVERWNVLMTIPSGVIGSLVELRVLGPYDCPENQDIEELYNLKHLNYLRISINTQHNLNKLLSNQNLQMCTRYLKLTRLPPSLSTTTLLEKLELLSNLETLILFACLPESNMGVWENHPMTQQQQQHLDSSCFQNLSTIEISGCHSLKDLTWVGYVPNLKTLDVSYCHKLEEIVIVVVDDLGGSIRGDEISMVMNNVKDDVFKRLKRLVILDLPKLKSICRNALAFPCLEDIDVSYCPLLKKLPLDSGSNVNNTLRVIKGGPKWWNELQWGEEEDHNNNNNNNNSELLKSKFLPYFIEVSNYDW